MNWMMTEMHNLPVTLCGVFDSVLCIFSIVTGLMYAGGKKQLNPLYLSDQFVAKLSDDDKMKQFAIKMGWVTFVVGIVQGLTALAIFTVAFWVVFSIQINGPGSFPSQQNLL